jgi:hypothetical protein
MNNPGRQAGLCEHATERQFDDGEPIESSFDHASRFRIAADDSAPENSSPPWLSDTFDERSLSQFILEPAPRTMWYRAKSLARATAMRYVPPVGRFGRVKRGIHKALAILAEEGALRMAVRATLKLTRMVQHRLEFGPEARKAKAAIERFKLVEKVIARAKARHDLGGASSGRGRLEVLHLLEHRCQPCRHFKHSGCSLMKKHFWRSSKKAFIKVAADAAGRCPKGYWPEPDAPPVTRLNLVYFIYPMRHPNHVWQWNVAELLKRIHLFNGRRIITVAVDSEEMAGRGRPVDSPEAVVAAFAGHDVEFRFVTNDPRTGEAPHFVKAMREIASTDPSEAVFYAHAKGVTRLQQAHAVRAWTAAMYHHNLDRIAEISDLLSRWPCAGIAKSYGFPEAFLLGKSRKTYAEAGRPWNGWHFCGTFWWARHDALFSRPDWDQIEIYNYATEKYLANFFGADEALCLAYDNCEHPYEIATWTPCGDQFDPVAYAVPGRGLKAA